MGRTPKGWKLIESRHGSRILYVRFRHAGRRYTRSTGQVDPQRAAEVAAKIYAQMVNGRQAVAKTEDGVEVFTSRPLDELFAEWLAAVENTLDETTFETYLLYVKAHFLPFFKTTSELAERGQEYVRFRLNKVQAKTVRKETSALRGALGYFKEKKYISRVPVIESPKKKMLGKADVKRARKAQATILEPDEVQRLIQKLPEHYRGIPVRARFEMLWETGLRPETVFGIKTPGDYRQGQTFLRIRVENDKNRFGRDVPLSPRAREVLDSVYREGGQPFGRHDFRGILRKAAIEAGLPPEKQKLSDYDFRHSRATYWVEHSSNLAGVAFLLGHLQVTTLNKYVRPQMRAAKDVLAACARRQMHFPTDDN